ncbi:MAG: hypothetical protein ACREOY_14055 [Candidatus Dormibacteraceae bacterium]
MTIEVIAIPGGVMPAAMRYSSLASALGGDVHLNFKDLEVYADEEPPAGYSIELEVQAVARSLTRLASTASTCSAIQAVVSFPWRSPAPIPIGCSAWRSSSRRLCPET